MGQQQLLLIVLGVIIVGIAVVVGINVFTASATQSNRDAVVADLTNISAMALQYYRKPTALAGGGNSFVGFQMPALSSTSGDNTPTATKTPNGAYTISVAGTAASITFEGVGTEKGNDGSTNVKVTMVVPNTGVLATTVNN